ncbi:MAG: hypothetical protein LBU51_11275 [Bacteroidales bacterium]|jgi:hypothetical protein|nr:hypothetical protein [Bacteroidales bacterium]
MENIYISKEKSEEIINACKLLPVIEKFIPLKKSGTNMVGECPMCGNKKSFNVSIGKEMFKCFKCDWGGNNAAKFFMEVKKISYNEALQVMAETANIIIEKKGNPKLKKQKSIIADNFKNRQLKMSGLEPKDVKAWEYLPEDNKQKEVDVFFSGTIGSNNKILDGDDMIIKYLDLNGKLVTYYDDKNKKENAFYRIRWQFPESHLDRSYRPIKYKTPYGANIQMYIPEKLRVIYRDNHTTRRLFFTEGEKKAEKMCKHGFPAFGMPGLHSLVGKDKSFPESITRFIERCGVKEVFFVLDSDYMDISNNLTPDKDITQRPRTFFYAVKKFKDWMKTLANRNIYLEVYLIGGKTEEKGVDDLFTGVLKGKENNYKMELDKQINSIAQENYSECQYFNLYKISTITDIKLQNIWNLNNKVDFCTFHKERLKSMEYFTFGFNRWKYDEDENIVQSHPINEDEDFVAKKIKKTENDESDKFEIIGFDYINMQNFFRNRGYFRYENVDETISFVNITNHIFRKTRYDKIKDFALNLYRDIYPKNINNYLASKQGSFFSLDQISRVDYIIPDFLEAERNHDYLFFSNKILSISSENINLINIDDIEGVVKDIDIINFEFKKLPPLFEVTRHDDVFQDKPFYQLNITDLGKKCDFLKYIEVTSDLNWEKHYDEDRHFTGNFDNNEEPAKINLTMLNKMTSIGYLMHRYRDKNCEKAIIAMDSSLGSRAGSAEGRTGKSMFGHALAKIRHVLWMDAKKPNFEDDRFQWDQISEDVNVVFLDDVKLNFKFDSIYNIVSGIMTIEKKSIGKKTITGSQVPKILLTTNHAINGDTSSYKDRQIKIPFSDFFSEKYKPYEFFGHLLFENWDIDQWNLFYNFMAQCMQLYFVFQKNEWGINNSGIIDAQCRPLEMKLWKQSIGNTLFDFLCDFFQVDDEHYEIRTNNLNRPIIRKEIYDEYLRRYPSQEKYCSPNNFWEKIQSFCKYFEFKFNPIQGVDNKGYARYHKSNGVEYITIANKYFTQ